MSVQVLGNAAKFAVAGVRFAHALH